MPVPIRAPRRYQLPSFQGVAAGQTASVRVPSGPVEYHNIYLAYGTSTAGGANQTNMEAEILEVRLLVNAVVQRVFSARELFDINAYHGHAFATGILKIFLAEPWARATLGEDGLAWGMNDVEDFTIEVDIDAGATAPTLRASALRLPSVAPMGIIKKWKRFQVQPSAVGEFNFNPPKQDAYCALHFDTANVNDIHVEVDGQQMANSQIPRTELHELSTDYGFAPQADWTHLDFGVRGRVADVLEMEANGERVQDFQITPDFSAAGNYTVVAEIMGLRD